MLSVIKNIGKMCIFGVELKTMFEKEKLALNEYFLKAFYNIVVSIRIRLKLIKYLEIMVLKKKLIKNMYQDKTIKLQQNHRIY